MRDPSDKVEAGRIQLSGFVRTKYGDRFGMFVAMGPCGRKLRMMVDDGHSEPDASGWEHVSVSIEGKHPPNWEEMNWVKEQFWRDSETVLQFHPKKSEYVNIHPNCLHLWRVVAFDHPLPVQYLI